MKDANSWPIARGNAADTTNGCQMTNFSYVEKDLNSNEHLNLNHLTNCSISQNIIKIS